MLKNFIILGLTGISLVVLVLAGCSSEQMNTMNPVSSYDQIPHESLAENHAPFVNFDCSATSVYPGTSVMVRINLMDAEDDQLLMTYTCTSGQFVMVEEGLYRWDMPMELGIYPLCVTVSDQYQSCTAILEVEVCEQPSFGTYY